MGWDKLFFFPLFFCMVDYLLLMRLENCGLGADIVLVLGELNSMSEC